MVVAMAVIYELAEVESPQFLYRRARVEINDDGVATVTNFQTGEVLAILPDMVSQNNDTWTSEDGNTTITKDPRCGTCGANKRTQVIPR